MIRLGLAAVLACWAGAAAADEVCLAAEGDWLFEACFSREGDHPIYGHGILGDTPEWNVLEVRYGIEALDRVPGLLDARIAPPPAGLGIFEDVVPRFVDLDADGRHEVMVVESDPAQGARVAIYGFAPEPYLMAATPYIGQRNRWFSPVGAADLDGDGFVEVAYVDRPHLARTLRVWRYEDGDFYEVVAAAGLTNHRIGETDIAGGIRDCGQGPEIIVADAGWSRVIAVRLEDGALDARDIGPHVGRESFAAAMACSGL